MTDSAGLQYFIRQVNDVGSSTASNSYTNGSFSRNVLMNKYKSIISPNIFVNSRMTNGNEFTADSDAAFNLPRRTTAILKIEENQMMNNLLDAQQGQQQTVNSKQSQLRKTSSQPCIKSNQNKQKNLNFNRSKL